MAKLRLVPIVAVALSGLAAPPVAEAADVRFREFINTVTIYAKPGEVNRLTITAGEGGVVIADPGAALVDTQPTNNTCRPDATGVTIICDRIATEKVRVLLGEGNDTFEVSRSGDDESQPLAIDVDGGTGNDRLSTLSLQIDADTTRANVYRGGAGNDRLASGAGDDILTGGAGGDVLIARKGDDRLVGGLGRDRFDAGAGRDRVEARDGVRDLSILCGAGSDALIRDRLDPVGVSC